MKQRIIAAITTLCLVLALWACTDMTTIPTTVATTTAVIETTAVPTAATTTFLTTTVDPRVAAINDEYERLVANLPQDTAADFALPAASTPAFAIEYQLNGVPIIGNVILYQAAITDQKLTLSVFITYQDLTLEKTHLFTQLRDEALVEAARIETLFSIVFAELEGLLPDLIAADLLLPKIEAEDVQIAYTADTSYIYENRFIFTFPQNRQGFSITASVTYGSETRSETYPVTMMAYDELPRLPELHITTEGGIAVDTKEEYRRATLTLITYDENLDPVVELNEASLRIKLRGNSTLHMPKKPFKIKFDEKTALLSEYAEKEWVLLANFADQTLIRNYLANTLSADLGMAFSPSATFVNVYLNGDFLGNYMLSDQIEVSANRVNVEKGSPALDTGYLIEYDKRLYDFAPEDIDENYFYVMGIPFVIKSPDWEDDHYSIDQLYYIQDYVLTVYQTLQSGGDYSNLIDEASFIDWFIIEEVFKNVDSGYSSVYFHKDAGGKLKMGPIWDFDLSTGNFGHLQEPLRGPEGWYTPRDDKNIFFYFLMQNYPSFRANLRTRWNELYEDEILGILDEIYPVVDAIARSRYDNFVLWNVIGTNNEWYTAPEILVLDTYEEQVWFLYRYLETRILWLDGAINELS